MAASKVPSGVKVPTWSSYSTAEGRWTPRHGPSVHSKAAWSTTRDMPLTPAGCQAERGSGRGGPHRRRSRNRSRGRRRPPRRPTNPAPPAPTATAAPVRHREPHRCARAWGAQTAKRCAAITASPASAIADGGRRRYRGLVEHRGLVRTAGSSMSWALRSIAGHRRVGRSRQHRDRKRRPQLGDRDGTFEAGAAEHIGPGAGRQHEPGIGLPLRRRQRLPQPGHDGDHAAGAGEGDHMAAVGAVDGQRVVLRRGP